MRILLNKILLSLFIILIFTVMLCTNIKAENENKTVKVGYFAFPGYHEVNDGLRSGYGYDFLTLLQRYTNLKYEYIGYDKSWDDMQTMLLNDEIDLVTSARKTIERESIFDFSEPIGTNSAQIKVRVGDDRFSPGDYQALNGIIIGELTGSSRNADVVAFATSKGFTYTVKEYGTSEELETALENKEVDAIATSSLRKSTNELTIAEFAPEDFYVIVKKGNTELLEEINNGISQMDINEGNWRDNLYYNNYKANNNSYLAFTQTEKDYIKSIQDGVVTIKATSSINMDPYSYVENGKLVGIIPDYFAHLMEMAGIPYTTVVAKDNDEYNSWVSNNSVDIIMDCEVAQDSNDHVEFGLVTDSYMELSTSRVTQKGFSGTIHTIGIVGNYTIDYAGEDVAKDVNYITYSSTLDALKAVSKGKVDACYVYTYIAEKYINKDANSNLKATILKNPIYYEYIYISPNSSHLLCSILNKCIKADSQSSLDEYILKYTTVSYDSLTLSQFLRSHPIYIILICVLICLVIVFVVLFILRYYNAKNKELQLEKEIIQQNKLTESLTFTNYFLDSYISAYYVNLETRECQVYKRTEELEKKFPIIDDYYESLTAYMRMAVHPDDQKELFEITSPGKMKEILMEREEYQHIFRDITKGERIFRIQVIRGADMNHAAFGFKDITEELAEQRKMVLGAVPLSPDILGKANIGLWSFELDEGKPPRMYVDNTMLGLVGLDHQVTPEETYHAWYDHIDKNSYDLVNDAVAKMCSGEHAEVQYPWHHPNGETLIVRCGGVRNFEYSKGIRIEGTHQNVTEVLHFDEEKQRKEKEDLSLLLINSLADAYMTLYYVDEETGEYQLITKNNEFDQKVNTKLTKGGDFYSDSKNSAKDVIYEEDWEKMSCFGDKELMREAFGENDSFSVDYRLVIDEKLVWYRCKTVKLNDGEGRLHYAVGIMNIEGELKQQKILEEALEQAKLANKAKTDFLFNMSHDIRTPMNAIIGFTNIAMKHIDDKQRVTDSLNKTQEAGELLLSLINDILDMSRIESGKIKLEENPGDVYLSFTNIESTLQELAETKNIKLTFEFKNIIDQYVYADFTRCLRVFVNIITNAIKYTNEGGKVKVTCEQIGKQDNYGLYKYTFKDNGIGMSEEFQKRVFDEFAREETSTVSGIQGTGLGLAVCKSFVQSMNGTIECISKKGVGSTFIVTLPFRLQENENYTDPVTRQVLSKGEVASIEELSFEGKKVLLVEDNELNREIAEDILVEAGIIVESAADGSIAVNMIKEKGPTYYDFVLMDIQMPIMDGYEATKAIREMFPNATLPIIALSANAFEEDKVKSISAGMNDHIAKPINIEQLFNCIKKYI